jgi:DNA-binding YbaB/EbfC family protein
MFKMFDLVKQAHKLQEKMGDLQKVLAHKEIEGQSGGGLVRVVVGGDGLVRTLKIDKSLIKSDEIDILEDLTIAAFNDARQKVDKMIKEEMSKITGGASLPSNMKLPF